MKDLAIIDDPAAAESSLDPQRARLLAALTEPSSAATLAKRLGLPRQQVNYHLRTLERHGLIELAETRRKGNFTERVMRAKAGEFVIAPEVMGDMAPDARRSPDRLSARWLVAVATRLISEVGQLLVGAARERKRVATLTIDGQVRFASAADRAAFAAELTDAVTRLVGKYHSDSAEGGRPHRVVVALHAIPPSDDGGGSGKTPNTTTTEES